MSCYEKKAIKKINAYFSTILSFFLPGWEFIAHSGSFKRCDLKKKRRDMIDDVFPPVLIVKPSEEFRPSEVACSLPRTPYSRMFYAAEPAPQPLGKKRLTMNYQFVFSCIISLCLNIFFRSENTSLTHCCGVVCLNDWSDHQYLCWYYFLEVHVSFHMEKICRIHICKFVYSI